MSDRLFESCWFSDHDHRTVHTEELYQAFKARLMRELVAEGGSIYDTTISKTRPERFALVDAPPADATAGRG